MKICRQELFFFATVFQIRGKQQIGLKNDSQLNRIKATINGSFICSSVCMETLPIHGNLRYNGRLSNPDFGLVENCIYLCSIVEIIICLECLFFKKVILINLGSSEIVTFEQIIKARRTYVFFKLVLRLRGQNDPHRVYDPVNVCLR